MGTAIVGWVTTKGLGALGSILEKLLPYAVAALAVWYVMHQNTELAQESFKRQQAEQVAVENAKAVDDLRDQKFHQDQVVADMVTEARERNGTFLELRKDILSAKNSTGCAGSPAVATLLDGLRKQRASAGTDKGNHSAGTSSATGVRPSATNPTN